MIECIAIYVYSEVGGWRLKVAKLIASALGIDSSVIIDGSILEAGGKDWS